MIYELRTYTLKQGSVPDVVKAASTVSRDIRKDDYGKLEGYWVTEIGPLNQVMHLWSYSDLNERAKMRAELAKNPRWSSEYVPLIRPLLVRQEVRQILAFRIRHRGRGFEIKMHAHAHDCLIKSPLRGMMLRIVSQVPFPKHSGGVAGVFQRLRDGDFIQRQFGHVVHRS